MFSSGLWGKLEVVGKGSENFKSKLALAASQEWSQGKIATPGTWPVPAALGDVVDLQLCCSPAPKPCPQWCCSQAWLPAGSSSAALSGRGRKSHVTAYSGGWASVQQQRTCSFALSVYLEYTAREILALHCFSHCLLIVTVVTALSCLTGWKTLCVTN